jgi:hypothetical protein
MSKSQCESQDAATEGCQDSLDLPLDQQLAVVTASLEAVCVNLAQQGVDTDIINVVLLETFAQRMADVNDRETYDAMLEEALETQWVDITVH